MHKCISKQRVQNNTEKTEKKKKKIIIIDFGFMSCFQLPRKFERQESLKCTKGPRAIHSVVVQTAYL